MAFNPRSLSRRSFLRASALAATGGILVACAAPAAPAAQPAEGGEAAPSGEVIELSYMTPDRELENKAKEVRMADFNAKMEADGKPYRVVAVAGPATDNDLKTKLTLDAAAGTLPDIFGILAELVADFVAAGYLLDMGPMLTQWADWSQYPDTLKNLATYDGKIVGIPGGTTFSFFIRKDVLEAAGISTAQPNTWDDFYAVCAQVVEKTDAIPCGLPAATPWGGGTWDEGFRMVWLSFDGTIYDESDGKWVVHSPNLLKAFQVYQTLASNGWLTVDELLTPNPWDPIKYQGFPEGKVIAVTGGDWQWTFDWGPEGATPIEGLFDKVIRWEFPAENGKPFTYVGGGAGQVAAANTKSPEGVFEFITFANSVEEECKLMEIHLPGPSSRLDMADKCEYYRTAVNGKMAEASQFFATGRTYNFNRVGVAKIADGVARATEDIITGAMSAEDAMEAFATAMTDALGADLSKRAS